MKYPGGIKKEKQANKTISYANRGMTLENDLNITNTYYVQHNIAFIYKKPTPIQVTKIDYEQNKIISAYFEKPSTTDYNGLYQGYYIDFEAKETKNKNSFPLSNINYHQLEHLKNINLHQGIAFLIVRFSTLDKTFVLFSNDLFHYIDNVNNKKISIDYFLEKGHLIKEGYLPRLDYIKIIDKHIGGLNEK